jgi:hypothetical protein
VKYGERIGLKEETITSFVRDRLKKARILAVPRNSSTAAQSALSLELTVDFMEMTGLGSYVFCVGGMSHQIATLRDSKAILPVITWTDLHLGWSKASNGVVVREAVDKVLDQFIKDWQTAHKSTSKPKPGTSSSSDAGVLIFGDPVPMPKSKKAALRAAFIEQDSYCYDVVNALPLEEFLKRKLSILLAVENHSLSEPDIGYRCYGSNHGTKTTSPASLIDIGQRLERPTPTSR